MKGLRNLLRRIPAKWRSLFYDSVSAVLFLWGVWTAVQGDWQAAILQVLGAVGAQVPSANVTKGDPPGPPDAGPQDDEATVLDEPGPADSVPE